MPSTARTRRKRRVKYAPSEQDRRTVSTMVSVGLNQNDICAALDITVPTLHRHFRRELDQSYIRMVARMRVALIKKAEAGDSPCLIYVNKVLGWNDRLVVVDGSSEINPQTLTDAELDTALARLRRRPAVIAAMKAGTLH